MYNCIIKWSKFSMEFFQKSYYKTLDTSKHLCNTIPIVNNKLNNKQKNEMKTKNKNKKSVSQTQSQKGKRNGQVGAPPKPVRFPRGQFTMKTLFGLNSQGRTAQCQLSVRTKVDALIASGDLIRLVSRKQAKHGVGRPESVFVTKDNFNASKMTRFGQKVATTPVVNRRIHRTARNTAIPVTIPQTKVTTTEEVPATPATVVENTQVTDVTVDEAIAA